MDPSIFSVHEITVFIPSTILPHHHTHVTFPRRRLLRNPNPIPAPTDRSTDSSLSHSPHPPPPLQTLLPVFPLDLPKTYILRPHTTCFSPSTFPAPASRTSESLTSSPPRCDRNKHDILASHPCASLCVQTFTAPVVGSLFFPLFFVQRSRTGRSPTCH